jgi:hypothetical protein
VTKDSVQPRRIGTWAQVLAWVITITGVPAVGAYLYALIAGSHEGSRPRAAIGLLVLLWMLPVFAFVAVKGAAPRRWPGFTVRRWRTSDSSVEVDSVGKE